MALSTDDELDSVLPAGYGNFVEVDGKLQPMPKGAVTKRSVTEETLWEAQIKGGALTLDASITLKLTNLRAMRDDQWLMLKDCDVVVEIKAEQEAIERMKAQGINDITCSSCAKKNPLGSKFCRHCGSKL
jgi:ribosomal protein L40E